MNEHRYVCLVDFDPGKTRAKSILTINSMQNHRVNRNAILILVNWIKSKGLNYFSAPLPPFLPSYKFPFFGSLTITSYKICQMVSFIGAYFLPMLLMCLFFAYVGFTTKVAAIETSNLHDRSSDRLTWKFCLWHR